MYAAAPEPYSGSPCKIIKCETEDQCVLSQLFADSDILSSDESAGSSLDKQIDIEITIYCMEENLNLDQNPLQWWKVEEPKYPNLSKLAKIYLAIKGTSVASERIFSTAGDVVRAERSSFTLDNVDMLIFIKKNLA